MNFKKFLNESEFEKMEYYYNKRTKEHINRVIKNSEKIGDEELLNQCIFHDASKYSNEEYIPYVHLTWKYKMQAEGKLYDTGEEMMKKTEEAWQHHIEKNSHHPEHWANGKVKGILDVTRMPEICIAEMVCDWVSMTQELEGKNDSTEWINSNVNKKWYFSEEQIQFINKYHDMLK